MQFLMIRTYGHVPKAPCVPLPCSGPFLDFDPILPAWPERAVHTLELQLTLATGPHVEYAPPGATVAVRRSDKPGRTQKQAI